MAQRECRKRPSTAIRTLVLVVASLVAAPAASAASPAAVIACASVITQSVVLDRDVTDCVGDGLVVAADNVTLDLAGHTISGDGVTGVDQIDAGVRVDGHHGVAIRDGSLAGFDSGVLLEAASGNVATRLTITNNRGRGIQLLDGSTDNTIEGNTSSTNGRSGITTVDSGDNILRNNVTQSNGFAGIASLNSDGNLIEHNVVAGNAEVGINVQSARNTVRANRVSRNGDDIIAVGDGNVIDSNKVSDAIGCEENGCGFGITVEGGVGNLIAGNLVVRTGRDAIRLQPFEDFGGPAMGSTVVRANVVREAGRYGIDVGADPDGSGTLVDTLVEGNVVIKSVDDGIAVADVTATLTANHAIHNGGLGIDFLQYFLPGQQFDFRKRCQYCKSPKIQGTTGVGRNKSSCRKKNVF